MNGRLTIVAAPAAEPLSTADAKTQLRVDTSADDSFIDVLVQVARERVELEARRALITQTLKLTLDRWPAHGVFELPRPPLQSVTSLDYIDSDGNSTAWGSSNYIVDTTANQLVVKSNVSYPSVTLQRRAGISITYVAGYGNAETDVPERYIHAVRLLIGHYYENRESVVIGQGVVSLQLPDAVKNLIQIDRGSWF